MATIKFWQEMRKATSVANKDKIMVGIESTGEAMYMDYEDLVSRAGQDASTGIEGVSPGALPTLGSEKKSALAQPGTYTQSGGADIVVQEGSMVILFWDGSEWSLSGIVEMPEPYIDKTNTISERTDRVTTEEAVLDYATPLTSERILPEGDEFDTIDRPDIPLMSELPLLLSGEEGGIVGRVSKYAIVVSNELDRPDLDGVIFLDELGNAIASTSGGGSSGGSGGDTNPEAVKELIKETELISTFWEPPVQESYNIGSANQAFWESYDYWGIFDEVRINQKTPIGRDPYITRELLGTSTKGNYDVWRYEFKPANPTRKVIITGGTHGSERIPPMVLQRFFKALCEDWMHDPALMWARHNIHFVTIPLVSPYGFHMRNRRVWETEPFPATWSKTGDVVTVSFDVADFPTTNPNVSGSNYFTAADSEGIVGKVWISLIDSSNQGELPDDGYEIKSVINGQTVTIQAPTSGTASGTCNIFVSTDPNRGFDLPLMSWNDVLPSTNNMQTFVDPVAVPFNNKGTRAFSLKESNHIQDTYDLHPDATFAVDIHNGAADYDVRYCAPLLLYHEPWQRNNDMHASFTDKEMPVRASVTNTAGQIGSQMYDINSFTIEWGNHTLMTEEIATESQRWISNFILMCSRFYDKKIN